MKTPPLKHQAEELAKSAPLPTRAIFWEQGTGKTWLALATALHLYRGGKVNGVLVLAPPGVHENWASDEIPDHWPDDVPPRVHVYKASKAGTRAHRESLERVMTYPAMSFLLMSYQGFVTAAGRAAAKRFLTERNCLYVLDESARIKSPSAKRTRVVIASAKYAPYRRILTGTPIANSPFDAYSQVKFLDDEFWKARGFASMEAFKTHFGIWEQRINGATGQRFNQVVAYRNLNQLADMLKGIASRVTKDEVLDLPPKVYTKRYFDLGPAQRKLYDSLRKEFVAYLDSGEMVTAPLMIVRLLRLQQVACGYVPSDDCETTTDLPENPRMDMLLETIEDCPGQAIVWARFRRDVDKICGALGPEAARYDGAVGEDGRAAAKEDFQTGRRRWFVANPACAAEGLTLTAAKSVIYYSNSFNLTHRLQSEDRAHRIGQADSVRYIDLVASGTVDNHIVAALRKKFNIASQVTCDRVREWL